MDYLLLSNFYIQNDKESIELKSLVLLKKSSTHHAQSPAIKRIIFISF